MTRCVVWVPTHPMSTMLDRTDPTIAPTVFAA